MHGTSRRLVADVVALTLAGAGCGRVGFDAVANGDAMRDGTEPDSLNVDGPSKCNQTTALICDGFEGTMFDSRWMVGGVAGSVQLDHTRAYRGNVSARADTAATALGNSSAVLRTTQGLAGAVTGTIYLRVWAYFPSPYLSTVFNQVLNVVNGTTTGVSVGSDDGFVRINDYEYMQSPTSASVVFPLDRWTCLQLQVPSNVEGFMRAFVDGVEVGDVTIVTPVGFPMPAADHIYVGIDWQTGMALPATHLWLDELIVDSQPTTCAQ